MARKVMYCILAIFIAWLSAILLHNLGVDFYLKNYLFKRDLSWGILIHFIFNYLYPISLIFTTILFSWKKKVAIIPCIVLILYIGIEGWGYRPLRTALILVSISLGYFLLFLILRNKNLRLLLKKNGQEKKLL
ncbi:hypothetical protein CKY20_11180 [Capnocytophaga canis]|uniref:Uncharacterized protein n=1 Tax=Capnocytophaga canis TaxID=1848903 RepID=A0A3A1YGL3_9FLAO|nr:hypothetical protein CKY20_11180 [Capnocytophaga canis]